MKILYWTLWIVLVLWAGADLFCVSTGRQRPVSINITIHIPAEAAVTP